MERLSEYARTAEARGQPSDQERREIIPDLNCTHHYQVPAPDKPSFFAEKQSFEQNIKHLSAYSARKITATLQQISLRKVTAPSS